MGNKVKTIEIPRDKAVFWLDANGCWHNSDGKFRHKKIIDYFHSSIKRDPKGYHLHQAHENYIEKVYFHCDDKALFVFDVLQENDITLVLNTKKQIKLKPRKLFINNDCLYMHLGDEIIKFAEQGLMKIAQSENWSDNLTLQQWSACWSDNNTTSCPVNISNLEAIIYGQGNTDIEEFKNNVKQLCIARWPIFKFYR